MVDDHRLRRRVWQRAPSSDASAMGPRGSSGAGSGSMCLEKSVIVGVIASWISALLPCAQNPVVHALFSSAEVVALHEMIRPKTGDCVWMQLLKLRKTATSHGCKYEVLRGGRKHSTTCGKAAFMAAGVDAGHVLEKDPRLSLAAWIE